MLVLNKQVLSFINCANCLSDCQSRLCQSMERFHLGLLEDNQR
ncbi:hypothetical protein Hanom_Chr11g00983941 [Helianthus anomalus]